ncbi:MAG: zinc finger domain-containing protein [Nanoarchaeota archaeon]|nr:zinc finger domain-containing protein [Nanoarchaeota archaeon]
MEEQKLTCSSCKARITNLDGSVKFECPSCGKSTLIRCKHCREIAAKYTCPNCQFEGPN